MLLATSPWVGGVTGFLVPTEVYWSSTGIPAAVPLKLRRTPGINLKYSCHLQETKQLPLRGGEISLLRHSSALYCIQLYVAGKEEGLGPEAWDTAACF